MGGVCKHHTLHAGEYAMVCPIKGSVLGEVMDHGVSTEERDTFLRGERANKARKARDTHEELWLGQGRDILKGLQSWVTNAGVGTPWELSLWVTMNLGKGEDLF